MESENSLPASSAADWLQACEDHIRVGEFVALVGLLEHPPSPACLAGSIFYRAHIAILQSDYDRASALFHDAYGAALTNDDTRLAQRSLIWQAYSHTQLDHYRLAQKLLADVMSYTADDDQLHGEVLFVQGLIAANCETLPTAQQWLEQAHDLALHLRDDWSEARCCVTLAAIYVHQGLMTRAACMLRRVERICQPHMPDSLMILQAHNINLYRLRLMGDMEEALGVALSLPEATDACYIHYHGWLALSSARVAIDASRFDLAEQSWQRAADLLAAVRDNEISRAELFWEHAWLCFRQGQLDAAHQHIRQALELIHDQMDIGHIHGWAIAAIIDMERGDLGMAGRNLQEAAERFRVSGHWTGLASVLLHMAAYHLRSHRPGAARKALAEALTIMRERRLYGAYYWHPETMVTLCRLAAQEDIWEGQAALLACQLQAVVGPQTCEVSEPEDDPAASWGDFAASLAARRLAADHWDDFVALLRDPRPQVRRRGAQVLRASGHPHALALLQTMHDAPVPHHHQEGRSAPTGEQPAVVVRSFGRFEVLIDGEPLRVRTAGTRKALALLGVLLLAGPGGIESSDLALLLWPTRPADDQYAALYATISALRKVLHDALGGQSPIKALHRRYRLQIEDSGFWWDWDQLRRLLQGPYCDAQAEQLARQLYHPAFMEGFFDLLPEPPDDRLTAMRWEDVYQQVLDLQEEHEAAATNWMHQLDALAA